jgi:Uma2 family endonuclease
MPIVNTAKMTARQFLELHEDPPGVRLELVQGAIAVSPSPTPEHSHIDTGLRTLINQHVKAHKLGLVFGDVDTIFGVDDVRRPDIIYFSTRRQHLIGPKAMEGPPDLCVEIISPSSSTIDRVDKFEQYEAGGVLHYWIVDSKARMIEAYKLRRGTFDPVGSGRDNDVVNFAPFPKLKIDLSQLWLPPLRQSRGLRR